MFRLTSVLRKVTDSVSVRRLELEVARQQLYTQTPGETYPGAPVRMMGRERFESALRAEVLPACFALAPREGGVLHPVFVLAHVWVQAPAELREGLELCAQRARLMGDEGFGVPYAVRAEGVDGLVARLLEDAGAAPAPAPRKRVRFEEELPVAKRPEPFAARAMRLPDWLGGAFMRVVPELYDMWCAPEDACAELPELLEAAAFAPSDERLGLEPAHAWVE